MLLSVLLSYSNFYPRSPCGERRKGNDLSLLQSVHFYPRSPCGERHATRVPKFTAKKFLSTLSLRRATAKAYDRIGLMVPFLSTLSLRRATSTQMLAKLSEQYFYPRSPCGERPVKRPKRIPVKSIFLSTLSLRRATRQRETGSVK